MLMGAVLAPGLALTSTFKPKENGESSLDELLQSPLLTAVAPEHRHSLACLLYNQMEHNRLTCETPLFQDVSLTVCIQLFSQLLKEPGDFQFLSKVTDEAEEVFCPSTVPPWQYNQSKFSFKPKASILAQVDDVAKWSRLVADELKQLWSRYQGSRLLVHYYMPPSKTIYLLGVGEPMINFGTCYKHFAIYLAYGK
jgi:hypothetical protein